MNIAVIGAGISGLSSAHFLAEMGHRPILIEAEDVAGKRSAGRGRIFRLSHTEGEMIKRAEQALELWQRWERQSGLPLLQQRGLTITCAEDEGFLQAAEQYGIDYTITHSPLNQLRPDLGECYLEKSAATINTIELTQYLLQGVERMIGCRVLELQNDESNERVKLVVERGAQRLTLHADAALVCCGEGNQPLAAALGIELLTQPLEHFRFTFRKRSTGLHGSLIDHHNNIYGVDLDRAMYAIGINWDGPIQVSGVLTPQQIAEKKTCQHVQQFWPGLHPTPIDFVNCRSLIGLSDRPWQIESVGRIAFVHGENLYKFAPYLGQQAAQAITNLS